LNSSAGVRNRCFIVGASRSGTTLLQRLIAAHPDVHTFPETGVFLKAMGMRQAMPWAWLDWTSGKEISALRRLLRHEAVPLALPAARPRHLRQASAIIVKTLDDLAERAGASTWLEKTPRHFVHASAITKWVPRATVVHIVRDGRDVVASIVDRARRFPDRFPRQDNPVYAVRYWNRAIRAQRACLHLPGHVFSHYEDLLTTPAEETARLCRMMGLVYDDSMLSAQAAPNFVRSAEAWKAGTFAPIRRPAGKFWQMFDAPAQRRITNSLDWETYSAL